MYKNKDKNYAVIAIIYYVLFILGYILMGILYKCGVKYYSVIQWLFLIIAIVIVLIKDKGILNLGFSKENLKRNLLFSGIIVAISIIFAFLYTERSDSVIVKSVLYYLFYIAFQEEVIFRGFIQNYLFGLCINRKVIYITGALFFSLAHLPFQMFVNNMVDFSYIIVAIPQLVFTFAFHIVMCFITYKRKDILIPVSLHFAIDFVQALL